MVKPIMFSGIEKTHKDIFFAQKSANVRTLLAVAERATIGKVVWGSFAAVLEADDVVNLKFDERIAFESTAVFATKTCSLSDHFSERIGDVPAHDCS